MQSSRPLVPMNDGAAAQSVRSCAVCVGGGGGGLAARLARQSSETASERTSQPVEDGQVRGDRALRLVATAGRAASASPAGADRWHMCGVGAHMRNKCTKRAKFAIRLRRQRLLQRECVSVHRNARHPSSPSAHKQHTPPPPPPPSPTRTPPPDSSNAHNSSSSLSDANRHNTAISSPLAARIGPVVCLGRLCVCVSKLIINN
jgi:hypothetical protein